MQIEAADETLETPSHSGGGSGGGGGYRECYDYEDACGLVMSQRRVNRLLSSGDRQGKTRTACDATWESILWGGHHHNHFPLCRSGVIRVAIKSPISTDDTQQGRGWCNDQTVWTVDDTVPRDKKVLPNPLENRNDNGTPRFVIRAMHVTMTTC